MLRSWGTLSVPLTLFLAGAIAVASLGVAGLWAQRHGRRTNSLVTHALMAALAVAAVGGLSQGRFEAFGFSLGTFRWSFLMLLWTLPSAVLALPQVFARRAEPAPPAADLTPVQIILRVWVVASIAEEILTRGLIQSSLGFLSGIGFPIGAHFVSAAVLTGALAFSAMHLVLLRRLGAKVAPVLVATFLLGCVAGVYREETGSLIPAVVVHTLFNVGGTVPVWVAQAIGTRRGAETRRVRDRQEKP